MKLLIVLLITVYYLVMARRFFKLWLKFFQLDNSMSPGERRLSWVTLFVATILWPIVVPHSYLTLIEKKLASQQVTVKRYEAPEAVIT
jgi:hypothetical protein